MDANCVEVLELEKGFKSLTAKIDISKGTFLGDFWGPVTSTVDAHSVQIGVDKHIHGKGQTIFTNHSCSPNAQFVYHARNDVDTKHLPDGYIVAWHLIACRDIAQGEPITYDYNTTESSMVQPFDCVCKSKECLGRIQGFKFLSLNDKKKRVLNASPVIKQLFENGNN